MKRIMLFLVAILAMVAIMALPAMAYHNGYGHEYDDPDPYETYGHDDDDDYYDDDDRYPPGYDDSHEPRPPDCDWYGPYGHGNDAWWEYWCYWHGWGWEYVFWAWA